MNDNYSKNHQNPHSPTLFRVGERVFDKDWNELPVKERKNWRYVVVNRVQIGVSSCVDKTGYSEPVYFGYVFKGLFQDGFNYYYDKLLT